MSQFPARIRSILWLLPLCSLWLGVPRVAAQQVAPPTFTPDGNYYNLEQSVRIDCATSGATINYTTNGIDPTSSDRSVAPGGTVLVDHAETLKARATKTGLSPSAVKSAAYNIIGKMAAGQNHSLSAKTDGTVWAWGNNASGQLGRGTTSTSPLPVAGKVKTNSTTYLLNVATAAGGASHSASVKTDGTVWAWGANTSGQIGDGTTTQRLYAVQVKLTGGTALTGIIDVVAGADHCLALKTGGTVWTWGLNSSGQVGIGTTTTPQKNAVQVKINSSTFLTGIVAIAAGGTHSLALKSDGTVWAWGLNSSGQLGNGNTTNQSYAVQVKVVGGAALTGIADIAAGANHSLARKTDGTLWAWGSNANGQLADGTTNPVSTSKQMNAVQVKASSTTFLTGVNGIAGGASHSLALKTDGTVWSWGLNSSNQLGDGTATQRVFPVQARDSSGGFITGVVDFFAGASHGLVTRSDGTAWGWGLNSLGQAGSMTTGVNPNVALQILAGSIPMFIVISLDDPDQDSLLTWKERELGTNANLPDTDGDGIPDGYEVSHNLNPLVNDAYDDPDHDYFLNGQEYAAGTNPQNPDTDTDGALDGEDVYPLDPHFALKKMPLNTYTVVEAVSGGGDHVKLNILNNILYNQTTVWRGGAPIALQPGVTAVGMNDSGQIVGFMGGSMARHGVMGTGPGFRNLGDGTTTQIGFSEAGAINNSGVVVGWADFDDGTFSARMDLGPPSTKLGALLTPTAMNDAGDVVGSVVFYYSAAIWTGGTTTALSGFSFPYAINQDKYVAGSYWGSSFGQDHWVPLAWHDGETKYLPCQSNTMRSEAYSINKDGLMVGYTYTLSADYIPMLWQNAQYYNMNDLLDTDAQAAGWAIGMLWAINDNGVIVASGYHSGFGGLVLLLPTPAVQLITPGGDPVSAPVNTAVDGQNEFTYDTSNPGVLSVHLKAKVLATGTAGSLASRCRFTVDAIPGSTMAWNANNPGGQPTNTSGDYLEADVTFTGLPTNNSDFGRKTVKITVDGAVKDQKVMEVFFPRNANNHPGSAVPNWFFYWNQIVGIPDVQYGGAGSGGSAEVKAMTNWIYSVPITKTTVTVYDTVLGKFRAYGVGEEFSGIDRFFGSVIHEAKHVDQIARADTLLATNGSDSFRYGWSWNTTPHNHWNKGVDFQWGVAGVDDDGNSVTDDAAPLPPFEPGNGDDESLDHPTYPWWPNVWPLPIPNNGPHPIESEAINSSDNAHDENQRARDDWGDPGKNHLTLDTWDD